MEDRYRYARPRSPVYNPARASLPINLNGHMSIVPTSRREAIAPRGSSSATSSNHSITTTTYKINADLPSRGSSVREGSRTRRSNTVDTNSRPTVTTMVSRHRPVVHGGKLASPMKNPYRSSEDEYYTIPASSQHGTHRKRYSTTMDTMDMSRLAMDRETNRLREPSSRNTLVYSSRARPSYPRIAVRHADTVADDYGDDGYGYTNPRDLVQYDLSQNTTRTRPRRGSVEGGRSRPTSITGYNDIVPRIYEPRERRPPPSTRGFDKLPRVPAWDQPPQIRMPAAQMPPMDPIQRPARVSPPFEDQPIKWSASHRPKSYHPDSRASSKDNYFDIWDEEPRRERSHRPEPRYDDIVEQRGFGSRPERSDVQERSDRLERTDRYDRSEILDRADRTERYDRSSKSARPERAERSDRPERERERERDRHDRPERIERPERHDRLDKSDDRSEHKGRDALAAGIGIAGAALGLNAVKNSKRDDRDDRDIREEREEREERRRRDYDEEPRRHKASRDDTIDLGGRDTKERRRRDDDGNRDILHQPKDRSPPRANHPVDKETRPPAEPAFIDLSRTSTHERASSRSDRDSDSDRQNQQRHRSEPIRTPPSSESSTSKSPPPRPRSRAGKDTGSGVPAFNPKDAMDLMAMKAALNAKDNEPAKLAKEPIQRSPRTSTTKTSQEVAEIRDDLNERQSRDPDVSKDNRQLRVVSPPREESKPKQVKGILRAPRAAFPEDPSPIREGVAPLKDAKKDGVPPDARWTKISRKLVSPDALELGKERFETRDDFVIVLRVLSRDEVQGYAEVTQKVRAAREEAVEEEASQERRRARRERHERHKRERKEGERKESERSERRRHQGHDESDTTEDEDEDERPKMLDAPARRERSGSGNKFEDLMMSGGLGAPPPPPSVSATVSSGDGRERR